MTLEKLWDWDGRQDLAPALGWAQAQLYLNLGSWLRRGPGLQGGGSSQNHLVLTRFSGKMEKFPSRTLLRSDEYKGLLLLTSAHSGLLQRCAGHLRCSR